VERVDGGGYGEPNRDGPGSSTKMCRYGKVALNTSPSSGVDDIVLRTSSDADAATVRMDDPK
jgi:hypothetical protein